MPAPAHGSELAALMDDMGRRARAAARELARTSSEQRNHAITAAARSLLANAETILAANAQDVARATERQVAASLLDRLRLDPPRVAAMATALTDIVALPDPVGRVLAQWTRPNGLVIQRVSVPVGVIGIIFESRPNVTSDAAGLCLKSGNAVILRGGSDSFESSRAIHACLADALHETALPRDAVQIVPVTDRDAVGYLLGSMQEWVDVVVPRGGRSLVARVRRDARVPVIGHLEGVCHVYVDGAAELPVARAVLLNSKLRRTGVCGAAETLLVDRACVATHLAPLIADLLDAGCEVRGDPVACTMDARVRPATEADWGAEYLDAVIAVRCVDGVDDAMRHIARYGSGHTDAIVTADTEVAERFLAEVDSAIVLHNASTQFADGGEFGMGAEIGIATGRVHARGPVGVEQLTSFNYRVRGSGQVRP